MQDRDVRRRLKLVEEWEGLCIVCGHPFETLACVTIEHILPASKVGQGFIAGNKAPSHWRCNQLKADLPLLKAARLVEKKLTQLGKSARYWLNHRVPNRLVPEVALLSPIDARWFYIQAA